MILREEGSRITIYRLTGRLPELSLEKQEYIRNSPGDGQASIELDEKGLPGQDMCTKLTKEEFLKRLNERRDFFVMAVNHDFKQFNSKIRYEVKLNPADPAKPEVNIVVNEFANELVDKAMGRLIDLVYQDME